MMLPTMLAVFVLMLVIVAGMAIGVIMGRKPIAGSCGGVGAALQDPDYECPVCGDDPNKCENKNEDAQLAPAKVQVYDATKK
ncbi:(Na+)-NQR maturation NqrM [Salinibius halmophilus]|uniref:(Na+)-NQR maturation NqrM n=1 Tax=Salinibius halmophilus TaxID=1853216 RepID=UPI002D7A0D84|nr:(Na+)-NQR maturation NqrM [Salinibius halmophilus]